MNLKIKKAVLKSDDKKGIILSKEAVKSLQLKSQKAVFFYHDKSSYIVPNKSLVFYEDKVCIYYKRGQWYNFSNVYIIKRYKTKTYIRINHLKRNDLIVIKGANLLRLAYLDAFGASGHGHVH
jgi:hypothetical protein